MKKTTTVAINTHALTDAPINPEDKQLVDEYSKKKTKIRYMYIENNYWYADRSK